MSGPKQLAFEQFARIARALGSPHRLELLDVLAQGERSVERLARAAGLSVGNASQHLQQLRRAGLVATRKAGTHVVYSLSDPEVIELIRRLWRVGERNLAELERLVQHYYRSRDDLEPVSRDELLRRLRRRSENVSSYLTYRCPEMAEWEFLSEIAARADCHILLDVNNIYVSGRNHGFDPARYVGSVPAERVKQIHLAGHSDCRRYLIDTHDAPVAEPVWELYQHAVQRFGAVPTMIEREANIPAIEELVAELDRARGLSAVARTPLLLEARAA